MTKKPILILAFLILAPTGFAQVLTRGGELEVPIASDSAGGFWGLANREADHATVAMNDSGDVVIAYHTTRGDLPVAEIRQVEIAYYEYDTASDSWSFYERKLLGAPTESPLNPPFIQNYVKCERPDVVAVGDRFFVVWTRRYHDSTLGAENHPGVLECAWIEKGASSLNVLDSGTSGLGYELDVHETAGPNPVPFEVRECAGVPDAVVLNDPSGLPTVGVVYPSQTLFSPPMTNLGPREADLLFVSCSLSGTTISSTDPVTLNSDLPFNGSSAPGPGDSAGLYLPDLAPSPEENAFWLTYEIQKGCTPPPNCIPLGRVRLEYWKYLPGSGWEELAGRTFTGSAPKGRRRPMVSSFPDSGTIPKVAISFSLVEDPLDAEVVYEHWTYAPPAGPYNPNGLSRTAVPLGSGFQNTAADDRRPIPLIGSNFPSIARCYFNRNQLVGYYDLDSNSTNFLSSSSGPSSRPAVVFKEVSGAAPSNNVVLSWEASPIGGGPKRIWIRVD